ncbi:hypothetical protein EVG20_g72 [Dentipellis fragilis]|uniref:Uncharacterized protein n=1 Tax=Dentipellis fragilis TaxID=205917 RepID=A0A4Y9ZDM3_9AGAM|nr:hypothetical protein EVG20_g72 [Dentipellis fragilis]
MSTWVHQPAQNPWFKMASLKRRFPSDDLADNDDTPDANLPTSRSTRAHPPHTKRRRCTTLERGFAGLRLNGNGQGNASIPLSIEELPVPNPTPPPAIFHNAQIPSSQLSQPFAITQSPPSTPMETDSVPGSPLLAPSTIVRAVHVEEPTSPDGVSVTDFKMHTSSWYEPEKDRIVITDLDGSSSDEEDAPPAKADVNISPAVLDHLKGAGNMVLKPPVPRPIPPSADNMALVLFKPIGPPGGRPAGGKDEGSPIPGNDSSTSSVVDEDADAMDVEP